MRADQRRTCEIMMRQLNDSMIAALLLAGLAGSVWGETSKAKWITAPVDALTKQKTLDLSGAQWIWSRDEKGAKTPACERRFRREFVLPQKTVAQLTRAVLVLRVDDEFEAYINGIHVVSGKRWDQAHSVDVARALQPGKNVLAIQARNQQGLAGVLAKLTFSLADGTVQQALISDARWYVAPFLPKAKGDQAPRGDWNLTSFAMNPKHWKPAKSLGPWDKIPGWQPRRNLPLPAVPRINSWYAFRKTFSVPPRSDNETFVARIACDSKYWLWVNGTLVVREGQLKRPSSQKTYYDRVDLTSHLKPDEPATIAILLCHFGKTGLSHHDSGYPALRFQLDAVEKDKPRQTLLVSDKTWRVLRHRAYSTAPIRNPHQNLPESNLRYDARLAQPGWQNPSYVDKTWLDAAALPAPAVAAMGTPVVRPTPPWKSFALTPYVNADALPKQGTGRTILARLPYNAQVTPYLKIDAPREGLMICLGTDNSRVGPSVRAQYITRKGVQEFELPVWINGHQVFYHIPKGVKILDLKFRETGYDVSPVAQFTCNDPILNGLWAKAARTLYVNLRDDMMTCPDRERACQAEQLALATPAARILFGASINALIQKSLADVRKGSPPVAKAKDVRWAGTAYRAAGQKEDDVLLNARRILAGQAGRPHYPALRTLLLRKATAKHPIRIPQEKLVIEALFAMGYPGDAIARLKRRFGPIVQSRSTTLPEHWRGGTNNHSASAWPITILIQQVAGLTLAATPDVPHALRVRPQLGPLKKLRATINTAAGLATLDIQRSPKTYAIQLNTPQARRVALVLLPQAELPKNPAFTVNGEAATLTPDAHGDYRFQAPPGLWTLSAKQGNE